MSAKRKQSTLSQSSDDSQDEGNTNKKSRLEQHSGSSSSSDSGSGDDTARRKSRSKSNGGSDSGTARSKSSSKSRSRSKSAGSAKSRSGSDHSMSRSRSRSGSPVRSRSRSGGKSGSDSGTAGSRQSSRAGSNNRSSSRGGSVASKKSSSPASRSSSSEKSSKSGSSASSHHSDSSSKSKKLKKSKDHKASSKLQKSISDSHSDDEQDAIEEKKRIPKKGKKALTDHSSNVQASWRDEFDDGLDDDYIGGEEDRRKLETMTEREREEEYYRRAEKREELKKRFEISQKLKSQKKRAESEPDEPAIEEDSYTSSVPNDPGTRKKGYEEKYGKKANALSELKAKREERERKEKVREERQNKNKKNQSESESGSDYEKMGRKKKKNVLKASEIYSSSSSDDGNNVRRETSSSSSSSSSGESETERHNSKKIVKKAINIETKDELEKIRLSRYKMDKFVHLPIFKKTVVGCFVRVGIGNNDKLQAVYRCCEIIDTCETAKIYHVMKTKTNIGLKLRHGKDTRMFRLSFVSNQPFTDTEFKKWQNACTEGNLNMPTVTHLQQKEKDIKYAMEYRFSSYDVEKILASKKKFDNRPKNFAMKKAELTKERDKAQTDGRQEDIERLNNELLSLEERAEELDKERTSTISTLSIINDRNRKNNVARAYKGIREAERIKKIEGDTSDPFTRRKTRPKLSDGAKIQPAPEMTSELLMKLELEKKKKAEQEEEKKKSILPPPVDISNVKQKGDAPIGKVDIFDAHNFDLDINVDTIQSTPLTPSISLKPVTASSAPTGPIKRSIKLDEWKKKRGII